MEGAEVVFKATPISVMLEIGGTMAYDRTAELLEEYIIEWNLETADGEPLKITKDVILNYMERVFVSRICAEWLKAATGVSAPLDKPSTSGEPSPEPSMEMETL